MGRPTPRHSSSRRSNRAVTAVAAVAAIAIGGGAAAYALRDSGDSGSAAATCTTTDTVKVGVPAALKSVVSQATSEAQQQGSRCVTYSVATANPETVSAQVAAGSTDVPDVWISDDAAWVQKASKSTRKDSTARTLTTGATLATSPVVVAVPQSLKSQSWAKGSPSWPTLLQPKVPLTAQSLDSSSATIAAVGDARTSIRNDEDKATYFTAMLRMTRGAKDLTELSSTALMGSDVSRAFFASEQQIVAANKLQPSSPMSAVVPSSGAGNLEYQLVYPASRSAAPSAVRALTERLTDAATKAKLKAAGFRTTGAAAPSGSPVAADVKLAGTPDSAMNISTIRAWRNLGRDVRMLAAVDGSGSMGDPVTKYGQDRMQLFQGVAHLAVNTMPRDGQVGALGFSTVHKGGYKWYTDGTESLSSAASRKKLLTTVDKTMPKVVNGHGDTPLYNATWAGFNYLNKTYDPKLLNVLVVLTDGQNDYPAGGLKLDQLISRIKGSYNSKKPVQIVTISLSKDTSPSALRKISAASDGRFYQVEQPEQITSVFIDVFLNL